MAQAHEFYGPATALRIGAWADFAAAHVLGGLAEALTAWVRGDLVISREELIERSTDLFVLVADHVAGPVTERALGWLAELSESHQSLIPMRAGRSKVSVPGGGGLRSSRERRRRTKGPAHGGRPHE